MKTWIWWMGASAAIVLAVLAGTVMTGRMRPDPTPTPSPTTLSKAERAYLEEMAEDALILGRAMDVAAEIANRYGDWTEGDVETLAAALAVMVVGDEKWSVRSSPSGRFERLHALWTGSLRSYSLGARELADGIDRCDLGLVMRADEMFNAAAEDVIAARAEVARFLESGTL